VVISVSRSVSFYSFLFLTSRHPQRRPKFNTQTVIRSAYFGQSGRQSSDSAGITTTQSYPVHHYLLELSFHSAMSPMSKRSSVGLNSLRSSYRKMKSKKSNEKNGEKNGERKIAELVCLDLIT
jgi:hypothetical protein